MSVPRVVMVLQQIGCRFDGLPHPQQPLHTLDTTRRYCDRIVGMRKGRVVFDGTPEQLTTGVARDIYGADGSFSEHATSTEIRDRPAGTAPIRRQTGAAKATV